MAITYHNSASNPADNGSNVVTTVVVTPPASMTSGQLVFFISNTKITTATFAISATGGQTWNNIQLGPSGNGVFWCRYNGTWSADPSIAVTGGAQAWSAVMHVYNPTTSSNTWAVDQAWQEVSYTAPSSPFTVTRAGQTTTQANTVTIALFASSDDNTWNTLTGAGWVTAGSAQYRNLGGTDQSQSFAHKIQTAAGATGNVTLNQATLGGDAGSTGIITFYEISAVVAIPNKIIQVNQSVRRANYY